MLKFCAALTLFAGLSCAADFLTGQAARAVIGQDFFTAQASGSNEFTFGAAGGLAYANNTLFVADSNRLGFLPENNRVLIYKNTSQMFPAPDAAITAFQSRCPLCGGVVSVVVGQPNFNSSAQAVSQAGMRLPTAVASEGNILAVADTSNNRVLIWKSIPVTNGAPADIVLGQADFTSVARPVVTASTFRGPQGVWIQNGRLFVADTQNHRILIWNSIPTRNNQAADLVLGQPNFTSAPEINQINPALIASANTMNSPVSVTSDGTRLYVTDLGYNRVLIWNSIPTQMQQAADVEIGQMDMTQSVPNDVTHVCASNGTDSSGNPTYPARCATSLSFPRFALPDGRGRLFVADGGNDRVLIFNQIPTQNKAAADTVLGQPDATSSAYTGFPPQLIFSAANATPTPTSLAWDGTNLYVVDPTNYRVLVFTPGTPLVPISGVVNSASQQIVAQGSVTIGGTITANNTVTVTVNGTDYKYTVVADDTLESVTQALATLINSANSGAGDPNVFAAKVPGFTTMVVVARVPGEPGNSVTVSTSVSANATITASSTGTLTGGDLAGNVPAGTLLTIRAADGQTLADTTAAADMTQDQLALELGNVQVYVDGNPIPLFLVSPSLINAQLPFEMYGANSVSLYVRVKRSNGTVTFSNAVGIPVVDAHPGIFACDPATISPTRCDTGGQEPRAALAYHGSNFATATIAIDGNIQAGDVPSITIGGDIYTYTVQSTDTLGSVRDQLIAQINGNSDSPVIASASGQFTAIRLRAKVPGPDGNGIPISAEATTAPTNNAGVQVFLTAINTQLCCASIAFTRITRENPAVPGETIIILASGLGLISPDEARLAIVSGAKYHGPDNAVIAPMNSTGSLGVEIISAFLMPNAIGVYEIVLEVSPSQSANPQAQLAVEQLLNYSNIVTVPVGPQQ